MNMPTQGIHPWLAKEHNGQRVNMKHCSLVVPKQLGYTLKKTVICCHTEQPTRHPPFVRSFSCRIV